MDYSIAPGWKWINCRDASLLFKELNLPFQDSLLLSEGSLTKFLEALNKSSVDVEIKRHETRRIEKDEADYLEVDSSQDAVIRDVWLMQNGKRLVYASSVFPATELDQSLLEKIAKSIEPLGKQLTDQGLFTYKDKLEVCAVRCDYVNRTFNLPHDTILWARHYRFFARHGSAENGITASITEIFSHELLGNPPDIIN